MVFPAMPALPSLTSVIPPTLAKNLIELAPSLHITIGVVSALFGLYLLGSSSFKIYKHMDSNGQSNEGIAPAIGGLIAGVILLQLLFSLDIFSTSLAGDTFSWSSNTAAASTLSPQKLAGTATILYLQMIGVIMFIFGIKGFSKKTGDGNSGTASAGKIASNIIGGVLLANILIVSDGIAFLMGAPNSLRIMSGM